MSYLSTLPQRLVARLHAAASSSSIVLLFPFYWMAMTAIKPKEQLLDLDTHNPFYTLIPTFEHIHDLLFKTDYPLWLWNTMFIAVVGDDPVADRQRVRRLCDHAHPLQGRASGSAARSSSPTWCRRRSCSSRCPPWSSSTGCSTRRSR